MRFNKILGMSVGANKSTLVAINRPSVDLLAFRDFFDILPAYFVNFHYLLNVVI